MRRAAILLVLTAITGVGVWQFLRGLHPATTTADPWRMLPGGTRAILALPDASEAWERWSEGCMLGHALKSMPELQAIDRMATALGPAREELNGTTVIAAWADGDDGTGQVVVIAVPPPATRLALLPMLGIRPGTTALTAEGCPSGWHMVEYAGVLLFGTDVEQLNALAERGEGVGDSLLTEARGTLGANTTAHLLLRTGARTAWPSSEPWRELFQSLPDGDGWIALDLEPRAEGLIAGGVQLGRQQAAGKAQADPLPALRLLPALATSFEQQVMPMDSNSVEWHDGTPVRAKGIGPRGAMAWTLLHTEDPLGAATVMGELARTDAARREYRGKLLLRIDGLADLAALPGDSAPWCVLNDDWCLLASDSVAARIAVDAWLDGTTLADHLGIATELGGLATPAERTWWRYLGADTAARPASLHELGSLLVQQVRTGSGRSFLSAALLPGHKDRDSAPSRATAAPAGGAIKGATPLRLQAVRNHVNGARELLVQDAGHTLRLRTADGRELWQAQLDGALIGPVLQVDRYGNGKLQLLALTAGSLYLIDRNGRAVEGFPVAMPAPASGEAACYDYDADGALRILIPLSDGRLLNLGASGRAVDGWAPPRATAAITSAAHHLRLRGKDHLVIGDAGGTLHHLDRRGTVRSRPALRLPEGAAIITLVPGRSDVLHVIWRTAEGRIEEAALDGRPRVLAAGAVAAGCAMAGRYAQPWWATADSLFVRGPDGAVKGVAAPVTVVAASMLVLANKPWWAVRTAEGPWLLLDDRGRQLAASKATAAPAVLTDLDADDRADLLVLSEGAAPEAVRPPPAQRPAAPARQRAPANGGKAGRPDGRNGTKKR